jgi:ATP-binding cassette subfamily B protein
MALLARRAGLSDGLPPDSQTFTGGPDRAPVLATLLGVAVERFEWVPGGPGGLQARSPALVWLAEGPGVAAAFVAVLRAGPRGVDLLAPDGGRVGTSIRELGAFVACRTSTGDALDPILDAAGLAGSDREAGRRALGAGARTASPTAFRAAALRMLPEAPLLRQAVQAGLVRTLAERVALQVLGSALFLLAFWIVGRAALEGRFETGWLLAFALLLLNLVPVSAIANWREGLLAVGFGGLLRRRLLQGALRLTPEEMREAGAGQLLGRVMESANLETLALRGGFQALLSVIDLALAAVVLSAAPASGALLPLLGVWLVVVAALGLRLYRRRRAWTQVRVDMTERLVEGMVGHRTRLVQESRGAWHDAEDSDLERYYERSRELDRELPRLDALAGHGFLLAGLATLGPLLVASPTAMAAVAVAVGGLLLAAQALERLASGLADLLGAAIAWTQVAPLYRAAARAEPAGVPGLDPAPRDVVLEGRGLGFHYPRRSRPAIRDASLRLGAGDRALLQGPSGGGKSTLAALLSGLRVPDTGLLRLHGLDRSAWGDSEWRRRVALAPQFHENHVLAGPFAFNLLLGRGWPPTPQDVAEAREVCRELGLSGLLERMPGDVFQPVGETGWQLSHGERSRLYVARALLQQADVVILDEGFGALDPESLRLTLECARRRATTLVVLAHP